MPLLTYSWSDDDDGPDAEKKARALARGKQWKKDNPEKHAAQLRRYRANNPEYVERQKEGKKEWASENKDYVRAKTREWFKANPDKAKAYKLAERVRRLDNPEDVTPKPLFCESCGSPGRNHGRPGGGLHLDHCHMRNRFRGWLCQKCNTALGMLDDDPVKIEKLLLYILKERGRT